MEEEKEAERSFTMGLNGPDTKGPQSSFAQI
jgi:hypothetical protein